jgi:hypothetical protein
VRVHPVSPDRVPNPGGTDRVVAAGAMIVGFPASPERIRDRVAEKAGNKKGYDLRDAPYLVLVVLHSFMFDNEDFITGLYGSTTVYINSDAPVRLDNEFFGWEQGQRIWKNRRVSAVCAMAEPRTFAPDETGRTLYHNPGAHHRWSTDLLDAGQEFGVSHEDGQGLQMDWLT